MRIASLATFAVLSGCSSGLHWQKVGFREEEISHWHVYHGHGKFARFDDGQLEFDLGDAEIAKLEGLIERFEWSDAEIALFGLSHCDLANVRFLGGRRPFAVVSEPHDGQHLPGYQHLVGKREGGPRLVYVTADYGGIYDPRNNGRDLLSARTRDANGTPLFDRVITVYRREDFLRFANAIDFETIADDIEKAACADDDARLASLEATLRAVWTPDVEALFAKAGIGHAEELRALGGRFGALKQSDLCGHLELLLQTIDRLEPVARGREVWPAAPMAGAALLRQEVAALAAKYEALAATDGPATAIWKALAEVCRQPFTNVFDRFEGLKTEGANRALFHRLQWAMTATAAFTAWSGADLEQRLQRFQEVSIGAHATSSHLHEPTTQQILRTFAGMLAPEIEGEAQRAIAAGKKAAAAGLVLVGLRLTHPDGEGLVNLTMREALAAPPADPEPTVRLAQRYVAELLARTLPVITEDKPAFDPTTNQLLNSSRVSHLSAVIAGSTEDVHAALAAVGRRPVTFTLRPELHTDRTYRETSRDEEPLRWTTTDTANNSGAVAAYRRELEEIVQRVGELSTDIGGAQRWFGWDPGRMFDPRWERQLSHQHDVAVFRRVENLASSFARERAAQWEFERAELAGRYNAMLDNPPPEVRTTVRVHTGTLVKELEHIQGEFLVAYRIDEHERSPIWGLPLRVNLRCMYHQGHEPTGIRAVNQWVSAEDLRAACERHFTDKLAEFAPKIIAAQLAENVEQLAAKCDPQEAAWLRALLLPGDLALQDPAALRCIWKIASVAPGLGTSGFVWDPRPRILD